MGKIGDLGVWKSVDEYTAFTAKHGVYGSEAVKLKKAMDKLTNLPLAKKK